MPCFNTVAVIGKAGEDISALTGASEEAAAQAPEAEVQAVQEVQKKCLRELWQ